MKVLWIYAHPEQRSMNASLMRDGLRELTASGHESQVSDLYAMGWKAVLDAADVRPDPAPGHRLSVGEEQERAYLGGEQSEDIRREQHRDECRPAPEHQLVGPDQHGSGRRRRHRTHASTSSGHRSASTRPSTDG